MLYLYQHSFFISRGLWQVLFLVTSQSAVFFPTKALQNAYGIVGGDALHSARWPISKANEMEKGAAENTTKAENTCALVQIDRRSTGSTLDESQSDRHQKARSCVRVLSQQESLQRGVHRQETYVQAEYQNFNRTFCSATHNISFMLIHAP